MSVKPHRNGKAFSADNRQIQLLLLENNSIHQKLAVKMLSNCGYVVLVAESANDARQILDSQKIDIILADMQTIKFNILDIAAAAKSKENRDGPNIPIIGLSEKIIKSQREQFLQNGLDEYLPKPIFEDELRRAIEKLCKARPAP